MEIKKYFSYLLIIHQVKTEKIATREGGLDTIDFNGFTSLFTP